MKTHHFYDVIACTRQTHDGRPAGSMSPGSASVVGLVFTNPWYFLSMGFFEMFYLTFRARPSLRSPEPQLEGLLLSQEVLALGNRLGPAHAAAGRSSLGSS